MAANVKPDDPINERRSLSALTDSVAVVRAAMLAAMAGASTTKVVDWRKGLEALGELEKAARGVNTNKRGRGLSAGSNLPFVAIVGIDRFSGLREELGEATAEIIVREVAARIGKVLANAHLGRINRSSLEFTFFCAGLDDAEASLHRLHHALEQPIPVGDRSVVLDVTVGFAGRENDDDALEWLVDRAEYALAKAHSKGLKIAGFTGRDRVERADRLALVRDLRTAVAKGELFLCYQPKLNLRSGKIAAVEALVRWRHPVRGLVPPDQFIGLAEESEEIRPITEMVIRQALEDHATMLAAGPTLKIHVNISGQLVANESFAEWALKAVGGRASGIGFEITETAVIANPERALAHIRAFSDAGIAISIDDYGSGLSSLSYLKQIPAHELKIDKHFVTGLTSSHRDPLLVRSTIDLAHALDMEVTAEGVDNPMSLALLQVMGCDMVQGYHVSKPLALADLVKFLADFSADTYLKRPQFAASR